MKTTRSILVFMLIVSFPSLLNAATINVPADQPTIQAGINAAVDGDVILVAPGTYIENIDFSGKAITVESEEGADGTIIDGNKAGSVVTFDSGETELAVIDGFTIRRGSGTVIETDAFGGGIFCVASSPSIRNCTITRNSVAGNRCGSGGGIFCSESSPIIMNCTITRNNVDANYGSGGGICFGESSPTIINCTISENRSHYEGGGISCFSSSPMIRSCVIESNTSAGGGGGGISVYDSSPTIENCYISGNLAYFGSGIDQNEWGNMIVSHSTIVKNVALSDGGGVSINLYGVTFISNSILWGNIAMNGPQITVSYGGELTVDHCDVQGGREQVFTYHGALYWMDGNIDMDPFFVGGDDYHIMEGSPCIDTGADAGVDSDIDGEARPQGNGFDMGADEYLCRDDDGDGYDDSSCNGSDCDDSNPSIYPGSDHDGDGYPACVEDCDDGDPLIHRGADDPCDGVDQDCDGADGVPEIRDNGIDDDCDGKIDERCFVGTVL